MGISPTPQNSSAISRTAKSSDRDHQSWGILLIHRCVVGSSHKISWPCLDFHGSISAGTKSRIKSSDTRLLTMHGGGSRNQRRFASSSVSQHHSYLYPYRLSSARNSDQLSPEDDGALRSSRRHRRPILLVSFSLFLLSFCLHS